jgi:N-acetylglucosamine-6-sulfatase
MNRRQALGAMAAPLFGQRQSTRPNFVFILIDDLRWDALGVTGHPFVKTPHIDRIAREGTRFTNAFVTTPLCSPSRACFLTGQYAHTHGVRDNQNNNELSHRLTTFPLLLHDAGYETGYCGKWHMGTDDSPRPGFDRWASFRGQGQYVDPELNIDGVSGRHPGYMTDLLSAHAVEFIRRRREKPFALYVAHKAVHGPFTPADRHKDLFANETIRRSPNAADTLEGKPALTRPVGGPGPVRPGGGSSDDVIRNQLRCLTSIDEGVGQMLASLTETGALDNTVVIFTSDNGYFWGEHGLGDKRFAYEESIRIPLFVRYPRLARAGSSVDAMALNIDIAPTLLDLAGVKAPASIQGRSLTGLFQGKTKGWRRSFLSEYFMEEKYPRTPTWQAARTERWKYVRCPQLEGADELYDLKADPYEMKNVIGDSAARKRLDEMKAELARLLKESA